MRPAGSARVALLALLQAGMVGQVDAFAARAGIPPTQARRTLVNLCREEVAQSAPCAESCGAVGRPRVVYAAAVSEAERNPFDSLNFARLVWR